MQPILQHLFPHICASTRCFDVAEMVNVCKYSHLLELHRKLRYNKLARSLGQIYFQNPEYYLCLLKLP
ncbi:unnamed protein product [Moneuplotes crassus]|uniref:Uncharacterized protein n=1 Tax=Euplotes crassus TaxID=5936 RepID=A0AAD2D7T2_EUPCR|nr:unnamed protein product [Moneuplotes crassus]